MKVLKARAGVLTNLEVLTHLKTLQIEFEEIAASKKYAQSRAIWHEKGRKGEPDDVPTYEEEAVEEMKRLEKVEMRLREEERLELSLLREKEDEEERVRREEEKKVKKRGKKAQQGPSEEEVKARRAAEDKMKEEEQNIRFEETAKNHDQLMKELKQREGYYAVRPCGDGLKFVTNQTVKYLTDAELTSTRRQTPELIRSLMNELARFKLTKPELLQFINTPPEEGVELVLIVDELETRFPDLDHNDFISIVSSHLLPPDDVLEDGAQQQQIAEDEYDEEDMMNQQMNVDQGGPDLMAEDKWGREGLEHDEGRDIDE